MNPKTKILIDKIELRASRALFSAAIVLVLMMAASRLWHIASAAPTTQPSTTQIAWSIPAPTTWPAGIDAPSATYGWVQRDALDGPATLPVTQPVTQPTSNPTTVPTTIPTTIPTTQPDGPPIFWPAPGDISALLATKIDHTRIMGTAPGAYTITDTPVVTAADLEILLQPGCTLTVTPRAGSTSGIYVTGADFDFDGGDKTKTVVSGGTPATNVFRLLGARPRIANCTGNACHNFILFDRYSKTVGGKVVDAGGADGGYIHGLRAGTHVGGQFILTMCDYTTYIDVVVNGSLGEQCFREDWTPWGHQPTGNRLLYCTFDNSGSPFDKAALDLRNCRDTYVYHCTVSNMRIGELAQATSVGQWVSGYLIDGCSFTHLDAVVPSIDAKSGTAGAIQNCKFPATPQWTPAIQRTAINVGTFATVSLYGNTRSPGPGVTVMSPNLAGGSAASTKIVNATQPAVAGK